MRLGYKKFKEIKKWYGSSDFEIGYESDGLSIRFGYWRSIDLDELKKLLDVKDMHKTVIRHMLYRCLTVVHTRLL